MSLSIVEREAGHPDKLAVGGSFTIYDAVPAKAALLEALVHADDLELDLSGVDEMDSAGVQLLILLKREAVKAGKPLRLSHHSAAVLEVLDRYNLASYFGDPVVISPEVNGS